jgi:hypothetical protein
MRPRSASDWRGWWAERGERELRVVFAEAWPPLERVDEETRGHYATRLATLLGSRAPVRAIAAELGRMRAELDLPPDSPEDQAAAERVYEWFPVGSLGGR